MGEAECFATADSAANARLWARTAFTEYLSRVKAVAEGLSGFEEFAGKLDDIDKQTLLGEVGNVTQFLASNPEAERDEINARHESFEAACTPLLQKYKYGSSGAVEDGDV